MTKEELKNKISMALKDPILQQGFECICKNLTELEEENAELKAYNEKLLDGDIEKHNKIVELKEQVDALANVNIKAQNIIDKAKEIIGKLCGAVRALNNPNTQLADVDDFLVEAEKFIKECELCI